MKGRGAKMFERQKERMGKFTKDHKEEYKKYKGQQTRGAEGGHAQVRFQRLLHSWIHYVTDQIHIKLRYLCYRQWIQFHLDHR